MTIKRSKVGARMSQAVVHGDTVYLAGQVADDGTADVAGQTKQILAKIDGLLAEAGSDKSKLLSATIWLADIRGFEGRTWVRVRDNAVMHLCGRISSSPIAPMRYDVQRAAIDDKYWFPVQIRADEDARISGDTIHVRLNVKYSDYKAR